MARCSSPRDVSVGEIEKILSGSSGARVCDYTCRTIRTLFRQTRERERERNAPFNIPRPRVSRVREFIMYLSLTAPDTRIPPPT